MSLHAEAQSSAIRYALSPDEYKLLHNYWEKRLIRLKKHNSTLTSPAAICDDYRAAAFRSSLRVFLGIFGGLKSWEAISASLLKRRRAQKSNTVPNRHRSLHVRLALSLSSILFFHRLLHGLLVRLRSGLLQEKSQALCARHPNLTRALTCRVAPSIGASLAGFALAIYPKEQLRTTITLYVAARAVEMMYNVADAAGYFKMKPAWIGSWLLFPLAQGQLLYTYVFDRDCFPKIYGDFILKHTPYYIQRRPPNITALLRWPSADQIVDSLGEMARLRWPPFVSPVLRPNAAPSLPPKLDPSISLITSRAHPSIQHLSCALIHPSNPSCFSAYLAHMIQSSSSLVRFFTLFYVAMSTPRYKSFYFNNSSSSPLLAVNRLAKTILRTTAAISGAIGLSWGSICLFAAILPRRFLPNFRFFLGGFLGGCCQIFDRTSAGRTNAIYAARVSVDSLWKVGVKHRWWKGIKGGDVLITVASLALLNSIYELQKDERMMQRDQGVWKVLRIFRGEQDLSFF